MDINTDDLDGSGDPDDLENLVGHWLTLEQAAQSLGVSKNKVRQWAKEREIIALRTRSAKEPRVPAECIDGNAIVQGTAIVKGNSIVKGLGGTLVLLADSGFDDFEAAVWMFTADDSLPGRPIDALRENRPGEVRRRAQALAF